jgi:hypothetical protein
LCIFIGWNQLDTEMGVASNDGSKNEKDPDRAAKRYFAGGYRRVVLDGVGHFPHREAPGVVADAIVQTFAGVRTKIGCRVRISNYGFVCSSCGVG